MIDGQTHAHTHTHAGNDNTRRPKLASGKKGSNWNTLCNNEIRQELKLHDEVSALRVHWLVDFIVMTAINTDLWWFCHCELVNKQIDLLKQTQYS